MQQELFPDIKTSPKRQSWETGAVRDTDENKGTPHLMPADAMLAWMRAEGAPTNPEVRESDTVWAISWAAQRCIWLAHATEEWGDAEEWVLEGLIYLSEIARREAEEEGCVSPNRITAAWRRLSHHYERGAKHYAPNNWRKGMPKTRYFDSASRHMWQHLDGQTDEDHLAAAMWNLIALVQVHLDVKDGRLEKSLDDWPVSWDMILDEAPPTTTTETTNDVPTETGTYNQDSK